MSFLIGDPNRTSLILGAIVFALAIHLYMFMLSEMKGTELRLKTELYRSHFLALGLTSRILTDGYIKLKSIELEYESTEKITDECVDSMYSELAERERNSKPII
jgi:hypothetical protein